MPAYHQPLAGVPEGVDVKLLPQDQELYVLAQSHARIDKERAIRRRKLKWLWARLKEIAAMDLDREELLMKLGAARAKARVAWRANARSRQAAPSAAARSPLSLPSLRLRDIAFRHEQVDVLVLHRHGLHLILQDFDAHAIGCYHEGAVVPETELLARNLIAQAPRRAEVFEPVYPTTQLVSGRLPIQISDIDKSSSRDSPRDSRLSARIPQNFAPETRLLAVNARKCRYFVEYPKSSARDPFGWLGWSDSNFDVQRENSSL
jgi:hypothetical protein